MASQHRPPTSSGGGQSSVHKTSHPPPKIPDHKLLRCIGQGSYGEVWLACNTMGTFRAVKIVYRDSFKDDRPFKRELAGIKKFEPISRSHEGFVHVLHVGMNSDEGYFYYVMELGDDQKSDQVINPELYSPKTLGTVISQKGKLPAQECLQLGIALSLALAELHKRGLVHRDVKPSNIIFVNGVPKLADIGLVADANEAQSYVGTEGFIPPEGPGSAQADVFSLGKVLYEASTGKDRQDFPELPTLLEGFEDRAKLLELNEVILTACKNDLARRYHSAWDMHADLLVLANGKSVRRLKALEQRLSQIKRTGIFLAVIVAVAGLFWLQISRTQKIKAEMRQKQIGENMAYGNRAVESADLLGALPYFAQVLHLSAGDPEDEANHRLLFDTTLAQCPKLNQMWFLGTDTRDAEFNKDGTKALICRYADEDNDSGGLRIYDLRTAALEEKEFNEGDWPSSSSWSMDGKFGATACEDKRAYIWDRNTLKPLQTLVHPGAVMCVRFSPDGSLVVTACQDGIVRIWQRDTGRLIRQLIGHKGVVRFANFSHDGHLIVSAGEDHTAHLWDATTGRSLGESLPHDSWVNYAAFNPDDTILITASSDRKARLWDVATGRRILVDLNHQDSVECAGFSPDGRLVLTAGLDATACIWRMDSLQSITLIATLRHSAGITHATFSPDGHHVLTTCTDGTVRLWDLAGSAPTPPQTHFYPSENGKFLFSVTSNNVQIFNLVSNQISTIANPSSLPIKKLIPSRDGSALLALAIAEKGDTNHNLTVTVYDPASGRIIFNHASESAAFQDASTSSDGKTFALFGNETYEIWHHATGTNAGYSSFRGLATSVVISPNGELIATRTNKEFRVLNLSGKIILQSPRFPSPIDYLAFSPDNHWLLVCCEDGLIHKCFAQVWNLASGKHGPELWHSDGVLSGAFSPDSRQVATAGEDGYAKVWDTVTGVQIASTLKQSKSIQNVIFSEDGRIILTTCADRSFRLWSAKTGDPLTPPIFQFRFLAKAYLLAHGLKILTTDNFTNSWIWELDQDKDSVANTTDIAELLSGVGPPLGDETGSSRPSLERLWYQATAKYPAIFLTPFQNVTAWQKHQAEECEKKRQWPAAAFYLRRLASNEPGDVSIQSRLTIAETHLNTK
ncbi:MAG TPA: protein kinase [Verrucomicrobiae bacterium]|nr:protein kinase [Verrucomicrobiae bacterium]